MIKHRESMDKNNLLYFLAAGGGEVVDVEGCLKRDPLRLNAVNDKGWSALMIAADHQNGQVVDFLMKQPSIDLNLKDSDGVSVAHIFAYHQNLGGLESLSKQGVSFAQSELLQEGHIAESLLEGTLLNAEEKVLAILKFLAEQGANVSSELRIGFQRKNIIEYAENSGLLKVKAFLEDINLAKNEKEALEKIVNPLKNQEKHDKNAESLVLGQEMQSSMAIEANAISKSKRL